MKLMWKYCAMETTYKLQYTIKHWWNEVRLTGDSFFRLMHMPPSQDYSLPLISGIMELREAYQRVSQLEYPEGAEIIRAHMLLAMSNLQMSLSHLMAHKTQTSDEFYDTARAEYELVHDLMEMNFAAEPY